MNPTGRETDFAAGTGTLESTRGYFPSGKIVHIRSPFPGRTRQAGGDIGT
ncbi:hypothetical protein [Nocardia sp. NPDC003345]